MKSTLIILSFLVFLVGGCGREVKEPSELSIIGGSQVPHDPTRPSMYPSTIGLVTPTGGCTGTRIGDNTYLTATHCLIKTSGTEEETAKVVASNSFNVVVKLTNIQRFSGYDGSSKFPDSRGTDISTFSIQFKARYEKTSWDTWVSVAPLDFSPPVQGSPVSLAGFGCTEKKFKWPYPVLEANVDCTSLPNFEYMKIASSKIAEMNTHYFTLKASKDDIGIDGFISNGDSGGPVYNSAGAVIGVNSAGNWYGLLLTDTFYFAETYHSWVGYPSVKEWLQNTQAQDSKQFSFRPSYLGQVYLPDGSYVGEWKNGYRQGTGQMVYKDWKVYNGSWVNDQREGEGEQTWPDSDPKYTSYKGGWAHDKMNGRGTVNFKSGEVYEGEIKDNQYHGKGKRIMPNKDVREGTWVEGNLQGECILITADGTRWQEVYKDGKRVSAFKL